MSYPPSIFKDREEAGKKLGLELKKLNLKDILVLAVPSGGVPVGKMVAKILNSPLGLTIVRKIQFPWSTEAGFGAVAADGTIYLGPDAEALPQEIIKIQIKKAEKEVARRKKEFLRWTKLNPKGKTVILVDDGLAAGSTMTTAIQSIKKKKPKEIITAVPTASGSAIKLIKPQVDKLISLYIHPENLPFAVASSYQNWYDLTDKEIKNYLEGGEKL